MNKGRGMLPRRRNAREARGSDDEEAATVGICNNGFGQVVYVQVAHFNLEVQGSDRVFRGSWHGVLSDMACDILGPDVQPHVVDVIHPVLQAQMIVLLLCC